MRARDATRRGARGAWRLLAAGLLALPSPGCVSEQVADSARDVFTLRNGTMSELKARRGQGPFTTYDVPPATLLEVVAAACRKVVGRGGRPITVVEVSTRYGEVSAKEQAPDAPRDASYGDEWVSAVLAIVHPEPAQPGRARLEIHSTARSPLVGCSVDWQRVLPALIQDTLRGMPAPR